MSGHLVGHAHVAPLVRRLKPGEAIDLFVYRIAREIGSLAAALGGIDGLVFTGGIGENDAQTRSEVLAQCRWLGFELDPERNAVGVGKISVAGCPVSAWVVPTDEEGMIVRHTAAVMATGASHAA